MGRLRFNKAAESFLLENNQYMINQKIDNNLFSNKNPIFIEVGMGKGDFIINQASQNPSINFVGVEKYSTVLMIALKKAKKYNLNNLKFIQLDANKLLDYFPLNFVSKIFLNFSDPWPKKRHQERRLTSDSFLKIYKEILIKDAEVEFKTDNSKLYEFSLDNLKETKIGNKIIYYSKDIYSDLNNQYNINNIQTEYERKFLAKGETIKKIIFKFT